MKKKKNNPEFRLFISLPYKHLAKICKIQSSYKEIQVFFFSLHILGLNIPAWAALLSGSSLYFWTCWPAFLLYAVIYTWILFERLFAFYNQL